MKAMGPKTAEAFNVSCRVPFNSLSNFTFFLLSFCKYPLWSWFNQTPLLFPHNPPPPLPLSISQVLVLINVDNSRTCLSNSSKDSICNRLSPPLVDIVLFKLSLSDFPSRFSKCVCEREVSTPL